jgi:hypothetical protein
MVKGKAPGELEDIQRGSQNSMGDGDDNTVFLCEID